MAHSPRAESQLPLPAKERMGEALRSRIGFLKGVYEGYYKSDYKDFNKVPLKGSIRATIIRM